MRICVPYNIYKTQTVRYEENETEQRDVDQTFQRQANREFKHRTQ